MQATYEPTAEGTRVLPGTPLASYPAPSAAVEDDDAAGDASVIAGPGTMATQQLASGEVVVSATRAGLVHWEANEVSVLVPLRPSDAKLALLRNLRVGGAGAAADSTAETPAASSSEAVAPTLRSTVHVRVTRVVRNAAFGDIIAVDGQWATSSAALPGASRVSVQVGQLPAMFRASIRTEDVFAATGKKAAELLATPMIRFVRPGDIVVGTIVALADSRQFQISLAADHCGVVAGRSRSSVGTAPLERVAGEREAMRCTATGAMEPRWAALKDWAPAPAK
uniref:Exosome complex component CSL4 C-terminal domain-containing protein n=1 Tax=Neobodo designis TaxID=312471 RepID=A0A7S1LQC5_NEODS